MLSSKELVVECYVIAERIKGTRKYPNNAELPLLIYKGALNLQPDAIPDTIRELFQKNGYTNSWVGDVYDYHHFHTNTHEILAVFSGSAEVIFGGESGTCFQVAKGDVIIIPAGVAHKKLSNTGNFQCVGAYPEGKDFDMNMRRAEGDEEEIRELPLPEKDPVYGEDTEHLAKYWK